MEKKAKKIPLRKCTGCGEMKPKREMIRVVRSKEGDVSLDPTGKKPGRGAYICSDTQCLKAARKSHALERAFSCKIEDGIYDRMERELENEQQQG